MKRLVPGLFSSVSDAELMTEIIGPAESGAVDKNNAETPTGQTGSDLPTKAEISE